MPDTPRPRRLITTTEAAHLLGIHYGTLWRWVNEGKIEPDQLTLGGHFRWDPDTLLARVDKLRLRREDDA